MLRFFFLCVFSHMSFPPKGTSASWVLNFDSLNLGTLKLVSKEKDSVKMESHVKKKTCWQKWKGFPQWTENCVLVLACKTQCLFTIWWLFDMASTAHVCCVDCEIRLDKPWVCCYQHTGNFFLSSFEVAKDLAWNLDGDCSKHFPLNCMVNNTDQVYEWKLQMTILFQFTRHQRRKQTWFGRDKKTNWFFCSFLKIWEKILKKILKGVLGELRFLC